MQEGKLVIFSAPSGSGKTTLIRWLMQQGLNLTFSVSATSRKPRPNETAGKDYYFISPEAFKQKIAEGAFLEWEEVYTDKFYGTLRDEVESKLMAGINVLLDVDVKGGINIKKQYKERALAVFIQPPGIDILRKRLENRGTDSESVIQERVDKATWEIGFAALFDQIIINKELEQAKADCLAAVTTFIQKPA
jgi:guanylate kinase